MSGLLAVLAVDLLSKQSTSHYKKSNKIELSADIHNRYCTLGLNIKTTLLLLYKYLKSI